MEKVRFGKTEFQFSQLVLGTWAMGSAFFGEVEQAAVTDTVKAALDNGINVIDTAPNYGNSEDVLGVALEGIARDSYYIATKTGNVVLPGNSGVTVHLGEPSMRYQLENSLRRLKTDYIDLFQIHWPDYNHSMEVAYNTMIKLKEEGKIRQWGVCNHKPNEILAADDKGAASLQQNYCLSRRQAGRDAFPIAKNADFGTLAYGILAGGLFTGKYTKAPDTTTTERRSLFYTEFKAENFDRAQKLIDAVKKVADGRGVTMAQVAINWALCDPHVDCALVGAKKPEQAIDNIKAASFKLTAEEKAFLDSVVY